MRILGRINYLLLRLSRISKPSPEIDSLKMTLIKCQANLEPESTLSSASEGEDDQTGQIKTIIYSPENKINLNSLNLKFKGDTCVRAFLARLEELRIARKISENIIFDGFPDLVEGPALYWYRANKFNFSCYSELLEGLKSDFDLPDFDFRLLQEIRTRTQAKDESMVVYLSVMLGMMSRLSKQLPEEEKLDLILRNIRPEYSRELALVDVTSIQHLQKIGKRLELAKVKMDSFHEPSFSKNSLVPDFNYKNPKNISPAPNKVKPVSSVSDNETDKPIIKCFRCGKNNHTAPFCRTSRDLVCFKCGTKGVKTPECPTCSMPKN